MAVAGAFLGMLMVVVAAPVLRRLDPPRSEMAGLDLLFLMFGGVCFGAVILPLAAVSRPPRWLRERVRRAARGLTLGVTGFVAALAAIWVATLVWDEAVDSRFLQGVYDVGEWLPLAGVAFGFAYTPRRR
ncbi:MAG: hypothetical protein H6838_14260 [Planctomycetes bacterium]|nr:hypothetical protein [Planctomycetota bacterium]MCB9886653.1 hypothetical protein [Planctomycetota bacterium]